MFEDLCQTLRNALRIDALYPKKEPHSFDTLLTPVKSASTKYTFSESGISCEIEYSYVFGSRIPSFKSYDAFTFSSLPQGDYRLVIKDYEDSKAKGLIVVDRTYAVIDSKNKIGGDFIVNYGILPFCTPHGLCREIILIPVKLDGNAAVEEIHIPLY